MTSSSPPAAVVRAPRVGLTDEQLDRLASILDDFIRIPGTPIRIGLDPIIGLIPGLGDVLTGLASFLIVFAAWQRRLPRITITRMVVNIAIDTFIGTVPIFGDIFDAWWKSNRMNYKLLLRHRQRPDVSHAWKDWAFLLFLGVCIALIIALPIAFLIWLIHLLKM